MNTTTEGVPLAEESIPLSTEPQLGMKEAHGFPGQNSMPAVDLQGSNGLPSNMTSTAPILPIPQDNGYQDDGPICQDSLQHKSESSSASGDFPGVYEFPYSAASDGISAFAERSLVEDNSQYGKWSGSSDEDASPEVPQPFPSTTAFMVSEGSPESSVDLLPSRPKASSSASQRPSTRPPLSLQTAATIKKRKPRNTVASEQNLSKTLQIVQEDGQGGAVASSDFVSPPRGARRKGPLTTAARANAGMRRKNKDTCVQCRLNKRKVSFLPKYVYGRY